MRAAARQRRSWRSSELCAQAFRIGEAAWGIQFHAEVSAADAAKWIDEWRTDEDAVRIGLDADALRAETDEASFRPGTSWGAGSPAASWRRRPPEPDLGAATPA